MKVTILDDYHDTIRTLGAFKKLAGHDVKVWNDHLQDTDEGDTFSYEEISAWLREAGFINPRLLECPGPSPLVETGAD